MPSRRPPRTTSRGSSELFAAGLLVVLATVAVVLGFGLTASSSSTASSSLDVARGERRASSGTVAGAVPRSETLGEADGALPGGTTVFDGEIPGVANLDPSLLGALREAAAAAAFDGAAFVVDSGWRSRAYQAHLLREAISEYGSAEEAARWVATPETSAHVSGDAVDVGPAGAASWLSVNGSAYGLCRIYGNEPWHYELRPQAADQGCPPMYADAAHDPRMR